MTYCDHTAGLNPISELEPHVLKDAQALFDEYKPKSETNFAVLLLEEHGIHIAYTPAGGKTASWFEKEEIISYDPAIYRQPPPRINWEVEHEGQPLAPAGWLPAID